MNYTTTTLQYTTIFFTTVHYTSYTTLQLQLQVRLQLQLHYTNCIALQLLLHYTDYNYTLQLHYTTLHPAAVVEVLQPLQNHVSVQQWVRSHPCITTTHLSYSVLSLKIPPPPGGALLARAD